MSKNLFAALACATFMAAAGLGAPGSALAQGAAAPDNSLKLCGDKWRAARAAGETEGQSWTQYLSRCRARGAARERAADAAPPAAEPVFPAAVPAKFASEKPARARQKACSEQFQANKATGGNAGLRWFQKGGGYWSLCNKRLKETRA
jgi:hypothetical protein